MKETDDISSEEHQGQTFRIVGYLVMRIVPLSIVFGFAAAQSVRLEATGMEGILRLIIHYITYSCIWG
jgi:hypothetical protein